MIVLSWLGCIRNDFLKKYTRNFLSDLLFPLVILTGLRYPLGNLEEALCLDLFC